MIAVPFDCSTIGGTIIDIDGNRGVADPWNPAIRLDRMIVDLQIHMASRGTDALSDTVRQATQIRLCAVINILN